MPRGVEPDLEQEVDRLYGLGLDEFTRARDALAKRLKREGLAAGAAEVKALRKPTAPAWAVNQLSRRHRKAVDLLLDSGHRLREAQGALLSGSARAEFERAQENERKALQALRKAADEILGGASDAVLERVARTLRSAAVTDEGRELLALGRFTTEIDLPGFDALAAFVPAQPPARAKRPQKPAPDRKAVKQAEEALRAARARQGELEQEAKKAERAAAKARAAADGAAEATAAAGRALERRRRR